MLFSTAVTLPSTVNSAKPNRRRHSLVREGTERKGKERSNIDNARTKSSRHQLFVSITVVNPIYSIRFMKKR